MTARVGLRASVAASDHGAPHGFPCPFVGQLVASASTAHRPQQHTRRQLRSAAGACQRSHSGSGGLATRALAASQGWPFAPESALRTDRQNPNPPTLTAQYARSQGRVAGDAEDGLAACTRTLTPQLKRTHMDDSDGRYTLTSTRQLSVPLSASKRGKGAGNSVSPVDVARCARAHRRLCRGHEWPGDVGNVVGLQ